MNRIRRATVGCIALLGGTATAADAHVMPAHQGTIAMRGRQAYIALSLPAALFREADDDRDGKLSVREALAHTELLQRLVATRVHVGDQSQSARLAFAQVIVERLDTDTAATPGPAADVLVLVVAMFDSDPHAVRLSIDGLDALANRDADAGRVTVRASHPDVPGARTESMTLRPGHASVTFFAPAWRRAVDAAEQGGAHILYGPDHLLFLLTLVLAGTGWRYWSSVISSFTVAHAAVLVAAARGHAPPVPSAAAEVMIALSILIMGLRIRRNVGGASRALGREALLAAACGFVHGLGVVDAVRALQSNGRPDLVTLASFNGGIEFAQLAALAAALVAVRAVKSVRTTGWRGLATPPQFVAPAPALPRG